MGCHFLLQCMKVKSESEVAQSRLTLRDPMDCSLPGSSAHGIFQARVLEWGAIASLGNLSTEMKIKVLDTKICVCVLSHVRLFTTPWTVSQQAPLSMEFSREEYWSGLPTPGSFPTRGLHTSPASPALAGGCFTTEPPGKPQTPK